MKSKGFGKKVSILILTLLLATSMLLAVPVSFCYGQGGYELPAGGGGGGGLPLGYTYLSDVITVSGLITVNVSAVSFDSKCKLTIKKGTTALKSTGTTLNSILMVQSTAPPAPAAQSATIGLVYDFGPNGATFDPPITVTFNYDPANLPEGVNEENLTIAYYDTSKGEWVILEGIAVDPDANTISGQVKHFTAFAVIAATQPAAFAASDLIISPKEVDTDQKANISVTIANTGDLPGTYDVALKINNTVIESKTVTLAGNASQSVSFSVSQATAGTYNISIDGLSGVLTVKAPPTPTPEPAPTPPPAPTPAPAPAPTPPPAPTSAPTPVPAPAPAPIPEVGPNWWLIGGIIAIIIIVAVAVWQIVLRRRY